MVIGTTPVTRLAMSSRTALAVDGVKVTGTPRMEPDSFVAYMVTPLAVNDASVSVPVCPASVITVVAPDMLIESTVNSIMVTVPPPASGRSTLPLYWKLVIVAESTDIVHVALETTRPGAAEASLGVTAAFFFFLPAPAVPVGDGL